MHTGVGEGGGVRSIKLSQKNAIKHDKGDPVDLLTTTSIPLERIWPKPQGPPPLDFQLLCIYVNGITLGQANLIPMTTWKQ